MTKQSKPKRSSLSGTLLNWVLLLALILSAVDTVFRFAPPEGHLGLVGAVIVLTIIVWSVLGIWYDSSTRVRDDE
jgi:hypothetical protein